MPVRKLVIVLKPKNSFIFNLLSFHISFLIPKAKLESISFALANIYYLIWEVIQTKCVFQVKIQKMKWIETEKKSNLFSSIKPSKMKYIYCIIHWKQFFWMTWYGKWNFVRFAIVYETVYYIFGMVCIHTYVCIKEMENSHRYRKCSELIN